MQLKIIDAIPGPTTTQRVLWLIKAYPQGITTRELSKHLNRPVSMLNLCLKSLIASGQVDARFDAEKKQWTYYFPHSIKNKCEHCPPYV